MYYMNKNIKIFIVIFGVLVLSLILFTVLKYNSKEIAVNDKEELYVMVEKYLINQEKPKYFSENKDSEPNYNISDFQVFTDIAKLGIKEKGKDTYVYVWALVESYYVQDEKLINNGGYSIPYKFVIRNNEIVDYKIPSDGSEYTNSIKKIFPIDIRIKFQTELVDSANLRKQVDEHYSYLNKDMLQDNNSNRSAENVIIMVDTNTITSSNVSITITDNNENHYGWGVEFRVQEKINNEWKELNYISDGATWISIAYILNENNQLTQKLDIEKYYGKLNSGVYRIVKPVYDNGYIDIYSNEFEIK